MRIALLVILLVATGIITLPLSAYFLDSSEIGENLILPVQVAVTAGIGALLGRWVLTTGTVRRRALIGLAIGIAGAVVGLVVFFLLISGFEGA